MTRVLGVIFVDIQSVDGDMLSHMVLPVTISMIVLVGILFNGSIFRMAQTLYLIVLMYLSTSGIFTSLVTMFSSIFIDVSSSLSDSNSLSALQSLMWKPLWDYVFLMHLISARVTSCIILGM